MLSPALVIQQLGFSWRNIIKFGYDRNMEGNVLAQRLQMQHMAYYLCKMSTEASVDSMV